MKEFKNVPGFCRIVQQPHSGELVCFYFNKVDKKVITEPVTLNIAFIFFVTYPLSSSVAQVKLIWRSWPWRTIGWK